jgi:hypothetical protein
MKFVTPHGKKGNTLMMTLFFCLAIGMVIASILKLVSARYTTTVRSTDWNEAIPVLEAGVEEAMTHLHDDYSATSNGWTAGTLGGQAVYTKQRTFSDGSYFYVAIANFSSNNATIYSQGYVRSPLKANQYIGRTVRVATTNPPTIFTKALATSGTISMVGNPLVGGFDSRIGPYAISHNATGNIATDSTANPAISLGGATVNGSATTGPGGTITGGTITGGTNNNMNVAFPSNSPPTIPGTFLTESSSNVWNVGSGSYQMSSYSSTGDPMIVTGNAILWVNGSFTIKGTGFIQIMPGASLTLYVSGNVDIGGGGVVNNPGLATDFSLLGLAGCTSINYAGTADFIGTINAPEADFTMKGTPNLIGAVISKSASFNGSGSLLYDDRLAVSGLLIATGWTEL